MFRLTRRHSIAGAIATIISLMICLAVPSIFSSLEKVQVTQCYRFRGATRIDSSIKIVYFSNNDIAALGGLPLRRNIYSLLVSSLHNAGASVIGFDLAFTENEKEFPEYDNLFSSMVKNSGNVVSSMYFTSLSPEHSGGQKVPGRFLYKISEQQKLLSGVDAQLPFEQLTGSVSALGHTQLLAQDAIPLFVATDSGEIPALSVEMLRMKLGISRNEIKLENGAILFPSNGKTYHVPVEENGITHLNFVGGIESLNLIPALEFLQQFDRREGNETALKMINSFRGSIVLIGIIAEGKSSLVETPFGSQFPSIGIHATLINNFLHENTLSYSSPVLTILLALGCGVLTIIFLSMRSMTGGVGSVLALLGLLLIFAYQLFSGSSIVIPVFPSLITVVFTALSLIITQNRTVQSRLTVIEGEKEITQKLLLEKETHLSLLQQKLRSSIESDQAISADKLEEEIKKYKNEIESLKSQIGDFSPMPSSALGKDAAENFHGIVYRRSGPVHEVVNFIKKIASSDSPVLILGESGTGKELVARAIHHSSKRSGCSFIAVNCGALTETLLESELFGHEKGAFTGAIKERQGRFELADQGTIFLDEIGEISEAFQVKLLRVLQEGVFERVGGTETKKVDIRVVAATNRDLKKAVAEKRFREDLYYRLNVFSVQLPPLRERADDIPLLLNHFLAQEGTGIEVSSAVMNALVKHEWKGNIRELQSAINHAVVFAHSEQRLLLQLRDFPEEVITATASYIDLEEQIIESLRGKRFNRSAISETAEELGNLNRGTVAEYFRGYCFRVFVECSWDLDRTVDIVCSTQESEAREKARKKVIEYLANAIELIDSTKSVEESLSGSKAKFKNLPQRYHQYLNVILTAFYRGEWKL